MSWMKKHARDLLSTMPIDNRASALLKKGDKKLLKQQGTKETKDANVTYYGSKEDLASGDGPSFNQGSKSGRVFATSSGVTVPSSQSFKEARANEKSMNSFDSNIARQAENRGITKLEMDAERRKKGRTYDPRDQ